MYIHPITGRQVSGYNSFEEHCFYEETTKRQMFLIIEQLAALASKGRENWVARAAKERLLLKLNNIK